MWDVAWRLCARGGIGRHDGFRCRHLGERIAMDFWMVSRQNLKNDLLDIFSALGDLQYQYDWVITDHDIWYAEDCPESVRKRWQWTGLLMDGAELTEHLRAGYVFFIGGGVLSAVPKETPLAQVNCYVPYWEHADLFAPSYRFQMPQTQMEIICYDGEWLIVCESAFSERIRCSLPQAETPEIYFKKSICTAETP